MPPPRRAAIPGLLAAKDPKLNLGPTFGTSPYLLFNTVSPNNGGALANVQVRQALEYAINRANLIQDDGGPVGVAAAHPHPAAGHRRVAAARPLSLRHAEGPAACLRPPAAHLT